MATINTDNRNQYALITGATSGIGYELTKLFAKDGYNLVLVARNEDRLQEVANELKSKYSVEVTPIAKNLFQKNAAREIYDETQQMGITINALVNDAGQGEWGEFMQTDLERDLDIIQLNIGSLLTLTKLYGKDMVARNEGKILQLGSEASKTFLPLLAVYAATKAFVYSFSIALQNELKDTDVTVTVLLPGATDTDFFHKANMTETVNYKEKKLGPPEEVARNGYEALMKGEKRIITGDGAMQHVMMANAMPDTAVASNTRKIMEPSDKDDMEGRTQSDHEPSRIERETIKQETGKNTGDYSKEKTKATITKDMDI
jgi:short-subunit dehydrogenase